MTSTNSQDLFQLAATSADGLGLRHAQGLPAAERTARGAWFTPPHIADLVVAGAAGAMGSGWRPSRIVDPAAGGGALLLAAHRRWPDATLTGIEADPATAQVACDALAMAGASAARVLVGDGLDPAVLDRTGGADLVIANPPFLGQLLDSTTRTGRRRQDLRQWYGGVAGGYVDDAALFVLAAVTRLLDDGGVAAVILPEAILATQSATGVRDAVGALADVSLLWRDLKGVFPGVPTCAIAIRPRRASSPQTPTPQIGAPAQAWNHLLHDPVTPSDLPDLAACPTIGDIATATADFRDAYYLVASHVREASGSVSDGVPLIPVGLIDPAHNRWGQASVRFAKQRYARPVAVGLPPEFTAARLGPKLLVATQTRVLESLVDEVGTLLPTTPAITLRTERPWHVGAALTSAVLTHVARQRHTGAARSRDALKLSAKQVLALPLPTADSGSWDDAADAFRAAHGMAADPEGRRVLLERCARLMSAAYEVDLSDAVMARWAAELPCR